MESKRDIRRDVLAIRQNLTDKEWEEKSHLIYKKVTSHPFFLQASEIYCYIDYRREVATREIVEYAWNLGKKVAVPKVEGDDMVFYVIHSFDELECGYKGIPEPKSMIPAQDWDALVIMPGAVFDTACHRIGYGKGYYDKYLHLHPKHKTIGLAFELQMMGEIPTEEHDICPNIIITEENIYERQSTK